MRRLDKRHAERHIVRAAIGAHHMPKRKTREQNRADAVRRAARRQGLVLHKSYRRDEFALGFGRYWLTNGKRAVFGMGPRGYPSATLDDVVAFLRRERA